MKVVLGIRNLELQNQAFIMKLCWGLITKPNALWVQCLRARYECGDDHVLQVVKKKYNSLTWQTITEVWEKFLQGVGKKINDGKSTRFWWDFWTPLERPLIEYAVSNVHNINPEEMVGSFVTPSGDWDVLRWKEHLPNWVIMKMVMLQPLAESRSDTFIWRNSPDRTFPVK